MQSSVMRLVFALLLACVAAGANFLWLNGQKPSTTDYLVFKSDVKRGETITWQDHLSAVPLPGDNQRLPKVFVARKNLSIIDGTVAARDFFVGEMLQHSDINISNAPPEYRVLGPFRLISVGDRFVDALNQDGASSDSSGSTVTVAAKYHGKTGDFEFDPLARRLLQIIDKNQRGLQDNLSDLEILAVVAYPNENTTLTEGNNSLGLEEDELALFVPMPNVPAIPNVLLTNKSPLIGFVVPASVLSKEELIFAPSINVQKNRLR